MQIKCNKNDLLTVYVLTFQNALYGCLIRLFVLKTSKQLPNADSNEARKKTKTLKTNKKKRKKTIKTF